MQSEILAYGFSASQGILSRNLAGTSHEESLLVREGCINNVNWLAGHILATRGRLMALLNAGETLLTPEESAMYGRGSHPLQPGDPCVRLEKLVEGLQSSAAAILERLRAMQDADFEAALDPSNFPIKPEKATVGARVAFLLLHEGYHAGQIGTVRRLLGKPSGLGV